MNRASLFLLVVALMFSSNGCDEPIPEEIIRPVRAIKIGDASAISSRSVPGQASAATEVNLAFRVSGPLVQLPVIIGQQVQENELLAQIDSTDYRVALDEMQARLDRANQTLAGMRSGRPEEVRQAEERLNAATAEYDKAKAQRDRIARLFDSNAVSQSEYDLAIADFKRSEASVQAATENLSKTQSGARVEEIAAQEAEIRSLAASVENSKNQLRYTTLLAPFTGTVADVFVENYQTVQSNQMVVRLVDTSELEVAVQVPEQAIHMSRYVKSISCVFDAFPGKVFSGTLKEIGTEASQSTRTYPVTIAVQQQYASEGVIALPGMACQVMAEMAVPDEGIGPSVEVPETSILEMDGATYVWVIDEKTKKASKLAVQVGEITPLGVTVAGPETGQWIATAGVHYLREGQVVRLLDENANP